MKYCSVECNHEDKYKNYIMAWKNGVITPMKNGCVSKYIRKYLLNKWNNKCQICGWNEKNIYTDNIPLEIDHIDGDSENNAEINLRVLCPNCHSLTSTYGALNVGKGRKGR